MNLNAYLAPHGIALCGALPLCECTLCRPHLLKAAGFDPDGASALFVQLFAVPYLTEESDRADRNVSSYAVSEDYHVYMKQLSDALLPLLRADHPGHRFALFSDHSPIDEIEAAITAGLGVRGLNHLLLTVRHSSYVFLGEIITDLPLTSTRTTLPLSALRCHACGACLRACPMHREDGICRSALTQKKGELTDGERGLLARHPLLWGCDICQEVCPYTAAARNRGTLYTDIPFFRQHTVSRLDHATLEHMDDVAFARRAYAWRGSAVIRRNITIKAEAKKEDKPCSN